MAITTEPVVRTDRPSSGFAKLAVGAVGVVFGDIGTSVLYAFQEIFSGPHIVDVQADRAMGAVSMIFWTLTLIVSVKYVLVVMRASNQGEGGIMALTALVSRLRLSKRAIMVLAALGVFGAALFYGDGMITPAVSVLSAVEGIEVVAPGLKDYDEFIAIGVLVLLFAAQKYGSHRVGAAFAPIMLVWFLAIAVLGIASIAQTPEVIKAISPTYALALIVSEPFVAFLSLGSVVLCVTGAEALYADMGHFGAGPIRVSWFAVVTPALYLNYLGQAALVMRNPSATANPFYLLVPHALMWPMIVLATLATVIASQAVISGAFSMTEEAMRLRYVPRLRVLHTSAEQRGQIYVPFVNWALCLAVVGLIVGFRDSSNLASAYGIAVTGTFLITTILITVVARRQWGAPLWAVIPLAGLFLIIDTSFFAANLTKFTHGGWFPLVIGVALYVLFMTWSKGLRLLRKRTDQIGMSEDDLRRYLATHELVHAPGTSIFVTNSVRVPVALTEYLRKGGVMRDTTVQAAFLVQPYPKVRAEERLKMVEIAPGVHRLEVRYGFMESPSGTGLVEYLKANGIPIDDRTIVVFHSTRVLPVKGPGMFRWRKRLFSFLMRISAPPAAAATVPEDLVMEWTTLVRM